MGKRELARGTKKMKMETKRMDNEVTYSTQVLFIYQIRARFPLAITSFSNIQFHLL